MPFLLTEPEEASGAGHTWAFLPSAPRAEQGAGVLPDQHPVRHLFLLLGPSLFTFSGATWQSRHWTSWGPQGVPRQVPGVEGLGHSPSEEPLCWAVAELGAAGQAGSFPSPAWKEKAE